ncbi:M3 family metallopeptidase [Inhella gelatinilytica]|uniref:M3 family metallopeptidase n=1 Tax=Inhella gelatinilytica TaxID=2795030 RepID=A0A931IXT0_9BURK|nr:M3 family metallopeptidase [Inhella gelatinilytica]MBH9554139.1 M3 family metallopeptidase [Inhella gelatinilytica]
MSAANPLLQAWSTPQGLPPFSTVQAAHFGPAFEAAMAAHRAEIEAIGQQAAAPTFDNTVAALDASGRMLSRIEALFYTLTASATTSELQAVQRDLAEPLAAHMSWVAMHQGVFSRLEALQAQADHLALAPDQRRLLERLHLEATRAGARLSVSSRERYAAIMQRLAALNTQFAQNVLADEAGYRLVLRTETELAGLPDFLRAVMRQAAAERGLPDGDHLVTLSRSHVVPFLTFSARRDLREAAWRAWVGRGEQSGETDNRAIAQEILTLRNEQARLHGYDCFADYQLADSMAQNQQAVQALLLRVWDAALTATEREREAVQAAAAAHDFVGPVEAWDWRFYAEKVRQARYALDEAELKPFFPLAAMVAALFDCAQRLFGLRFESRPDWPAYHPDVQVYEVLDADGAHRAVFLHDNFARVGKRSGAWMNALRYAHRNGGVQSPVILNNNNFAKGAPGEPTLLSLDDVRTLFHEFGHGLHGMLSETRYERLSGTQVLRDFVELPSQLMEHWIADPGVMQRHAKHYRTGEPIPKTLIDRIKAAELFNQGYETVRYTASALVDLAIHALEDEVAPDIVTFERDTLARLGAPADCGMNHRLPHFQHLFVGDGYAAGYYVYLWAEVLDCDAFEAFQEAGDLFDAQTAQRYRQHILAAGNSEEPGAAYRAFRGHDARIEPMLKARGLLPA